jgi:hypothetical protein
MIRGTTTLVEAEQVAPQSDASPGSQGHFNTTPPGFPAHWGHSCFLI